MKILNLIIQNSKISYYKEMGEVLREFYKMYDFVDTYFVELSEGIQNEYKISKDCIMIKGRESMVPGILQKTIDALLILREKKYNYDWVVRTNVSTIIDYDLVKMNVALDSSLDYFSGCFSMVQDKNEHYGIADERYLGTKFAHGTFIGMSKKVVETILQKRHKIEFNIIDDVALGLFISKFTNNVKTKLLDENRHVFSTGRNDISAIMDYYIVNKPIAWRNKSENRADDIYTMKQITKFLTNKRLKD